MGFSAAMKTDVTVEPLEAPTRSPEERLMMAVLEEALATFERGLGSRVPMQRQAHHDVDRWVRCRSREDLFSFENVCSILGIDADYLRSGLARLKARSLASDRVNAVRRLRRAHITDRRLWKGHIGA